MPGYNAIAKSCYTTSTFELEKDIFTSTRAQIEIWERRKNLSWTDRQERMKLHDIARLKLCIQIHIRCLHISQLQAMHKLGTAPNKAERDRRIGVKTETEHGKGWNFTPQLRETVDIAFFTSKCVRACVYIYRYILERERDTERVNVAQYAIASKLQCSRF